MVKYFWCLLFLSFNSFAQDLPEHLETLLSQSQEYFEIYNDKTPVEIDDGSYDESERLLFAQIDQINSLHIVFSKDEIKKFKVRLIKSAAQSFDQLQIEAIISVARNYEQNKKKAGRFFKVAQEYKSGILQENAINLQLSAR